MKKKKISTIKYDIKFISKGKVKGSIQKPNIYTSIDRLENKVNQIIKIMKQAFPDKFE